MLLLLFTLLSIDYLKLKMVHCLIEIENPDGDIFQWIFPPPELFTGWFLLQFLEFLFLFCFVLLNCSIFNDFNYSQCTQFSWWCERKQIFFFFIFFFICFYMQLLFLTALYSFLLSVFMSYIQHLLGTVFFFFFLSF